MGEVKPDILVNIRQYINAGKLMVLSTTDGSRLHMCSVWYAHSEDYSRYYFTSRPTRVHSENIRSNGTVAGAIVAIALVGLGQQSQGVFFSGRAQECADEGIDVAYGVYGQRWPQVGKIFSAADLHSGAAPMRMYEVVVSEYVWIDEVRSPADHRYVLSGPDLQISNVREPGGRGTATY